MHKSIDLFSLKRLVQISETQCDYYSEACVVALEDNNKTSGTVLEIDGDKKLKLSLEWDKKINKNGWKESKKWLENGAVAISMFIVYETTDFNTVEEATIGTGIDYWLSWKTNHEKYNEDNYLNARLEISGINKESANNNFTTRLKSKKKQTEPSDKLNIPAYVSGGVSYSKSFICKKMNSKELHRLAMEGVHRAIKANEEGNYGVYLEILKEALGYESQAAYALYNKIDAEPTRSVLFRSAATIAFNCGKVEDAEKMIAAGLSGNPPLEIKLELKNLQKQIFQMESEQEDVTLNDDSFAYLNFLRDRAINIKIEPKNHKHAQAVSLNDVLDYLKDIKSTLFNFIEIQFLKSFSVQEFPNNYDKILDSLLKDAQPQFVNLNWKSFGASISSDVFIISDEYSRKLNNWKQKAFTDFKREIFELDYNNEETIEYLAEKYTDDERRTIFSKIIENYKSESNNIISLTDKKFKTTIKTFKPIHKMYKDVLIPPKKKDEEQQSVLRKTIEIGSQNAEGKIKTKDILSQEIFEYAEIKYPIRDIQFKEKIVNLKEELQLKLIFDHGKISIEYTPLKIFVSSRSFDKTINNFQTAFIEQYDSLIQNKEESEVINQLKSAFEEIIMYRNW